MAEVQALIAQLLSAYVEWHHKILCNDLRSLAAVTPEKVVNAKRFIGKLEKLSKAGRLARIAIDEAHCCSQWGNDFRCAACAVMV